MQVEDFSFKHNSLVRMTADGTESLIHFHRSANDGMTSTYGLKGNLINATVFEERQYALAHHMPEPVVIDGTKVLMSPMPGAIVEVFVQAGDTIVDGQ